MCKRAGIELDDFEALFGENSGGINEMMPSTKKRDTSQYPIADIKIDMIDGFPNHPFRVVDDEEMAQLIENISEYGVMHPVIVRKVGDRYQMISGHRRLFASKKANKDTIPARIMELSDDDAAIIMADANFLQRTEIKPSEKAKAYRIKYDASKRQGKKGMGRSFDEIGEAAGESGRTVQRFIRLSYLSDELLELVDSGKIGIVQGVDISFINDEYQKFVFDAVIETGVNMSKEQSAKIKEYGLNGKLIPEMVCLILTEKKEKKRTFSIKAEKLNEYFSDDYSDTDIEKIILELLDGWKRAGEKRD